MKLIPFRSRRGRRPAAAVAPGRRLQRIGVLLLVAGVFAASLLYWLETRTPSPSMEELMPGYSQANSRLMGIYYGHAGETMWEWREALGRPETQAVIVVFVAAIAAGICFRMAWVDAERARNASTHSR